jgi:hypothetical protein
MSTWIERLEEERDELAAKLEKLKAVAHARHRPDHISAVQWAMMQSQVRWMEGYLSLLKYRIEDSEHEA